MKVPENFFRQQDSHKGSGGRLLIVAGSWGYVGAGLLAAQAAIIAGCGYPIWALPEKIYPLVATEFLDGVVRPLEDQGKGFYMKQHVEALVSLDSDAALIGPGLGQDPATKEFVLSFIKDYDKPLLLDADALNLLAGHCEALKASPSIKVLTPHPAEAGRLLSMATQEVQKNRESALQKLQQLSSSVVVLKGASSLVASDKELWKNTVDSATLATAGSGDLLAGLIAAMLAKKISAFEASCFAVYWHGLAGKRLEETFGPQGHGASDIAEALKSVQKDWA
jgi:hydroxyethylthiazole kinase-like uncharacterized protein yjeF